MIPGPNDEPSFDPMLGFPNGRKERGKWFLCNIMSPFDNFLLDVFSYDRNSRTNGIGKTSLGKSWLLCSFGP
jgi:hypothetical protein